MALFDVQADDLLTIDNSYGHVTVKNHDRNTVEVTVLIKAWNSSGTKAQATIDRITIQKRQVDKTIDMKTIIATAKKRTVVSAEQGFCINYTVKIPRSLSLKVYNEFGNLTVEEALGTVNLNNQHGNLKVGHMGPGSLQMAHGNLLAEQLTGKTRISTKHGNTTVKKADHLTMQVDFGNCLVRQVNYLSGMNKNGHMTIERVQQHLKWDIRFGNILVKRVDEDFQHLELDTQHGNTSVQIAGRPAFMLDSSVKNGRLTQGFNVQEETEVLTTRAKGAVHGGSDRKASVHVAFGNLLLQ